MARRIEISYFERRGNGLQPPRRLRYRRTIDADRTAWIEAEQGSGAWEEHRGDGSEPLRGDSVPCCKARVGNQTFFIEGTKAELEELLLPRDCPPARQMGYSIKATASYVLEGEICGDLELAADAPKHHLDPRRLADAAQGWTLHRQPGDSSSRYTVSVRGAPAPRFTLQRLETHPEPHESDRWVDVTATLEGVQAGGRLRPKP